MSADVPAVEERLSLIEEHVHHERMERHGRGLGVLGITHHAVHQERADVPVITLSGYPLIAQMLEDGREGMVECLQKPIEPEDLATAVRRALDRAQAS